MESKDPAAATTNMLRGSKVEQLEPIQMLPADGRRPRLRRLRTLAIDVLVILIFLGPIIIALIRSSQSLKYDSGFSGNN